jgi:hypothetical protein
MVAMPKWKKDATEFEVGVSYNDVRGAQSSIPKPIWDILGHPETIKFVLKGKKVEVEAGTDATHNE